MAKKLIRTSTSLVPDEVVLNKIYMIRGKKVMLDEDLAELYQVETKRLNEQVKRNKERFPDDFMFSLNHQEFTILKSQNATSRWGGRRTPPNAFTEHGVLMLSSVLSSDRAIQINIRIMRVYIKVREIFLHDKDLSMQITKLESRMDKQDEKIDTVFLYIDKFVEKEVKPRKQIGFKTDEDAGNGHGRK